MIVGRRCTPRWTPDRLHDFRDGDRGRRVGETSQNTNCLRRRVGPFQCVSLDFLNTIIPERMHIAHVVLLVWYIRIVYYITFHGRGELSVRGKVQTIRREQIFRTKCRYSHYKIIT